MAFNALKIGSSQFYAPPLSSSSPNPNLIFPHSCSTKPPRRISIPSCLTIKASSSSTAATSPVPSPDMFRVDILSESLPYIQKFRGKTIVVKYGGAAMKLPHLKASVVSDLVLLACVGLRPILVHGGGPEINHWLQQLNIQPLFHEGLRVTDAKTMEIVSMVLVGKVNKDLVSLINKAGATGEQRAHPGDCVGGGRRVRALVQHQ